ncbi:hypothetical protein ACFE04_010056 [Oxalis oulophora]
MALSRSYFFILAIIFYIYTSYVECANFNVSDINGGGGWQQAGATFYGPPGGGGSTGGACGYQNAVEQGVFNALVTAGGASLFKGGKGCGACYQVKCTSNPACSGYPITVTVTDECPGGPCAAEPVHFDLSGKAMAYMAKPGQGGRLHAAGVVQIQYRKTNCFYPKTKLTFKIDAGDNPYYFAVLISYVSKDGELGMVEVQQAGSNVWQRMDESIGAVWKINVPTGIKGPLSLRLTSLESKKSIIAYNVIPSQFGPGQTFVTNVNF